MSFRPILVCLASGVISASAMAQPSNIRVIGAKLEADPKQYAGQCPTTIHFHGSIETNGPGVVKYIFERSDGATDTIVKSVTFAAPPYHKTIPDDTWTLGTPGTSYDGWERIKILSPNAGFLSNKAEFHIRCAGTAGTRPNPNNNPTGTPNGQPDLIVTEFGFTGPVPSAAANTALCQPQTVVYNFQVTVKNQGTAPSASSASLGNRALVQVMAQDVAPPGWGNGALLNALAPGASQTVNVPVYYLMSNPAFMVSGAPHPFMAIADPLSLVNESVESNNTKGPINMGAPAGCPKP